jgi:hypothetical protein
VKGGRVEADHAREQMGEQRGGLSQEGALGLYPAKLPEQHEGDHFGVGELLESTIVASFGVEVGVVDFAEQDAMIASSRRARRGAC